MSPSRSSSNESTAPTPSACTARRTRSANAWNSSFFDTGSVSQPTPTIEPTPPSMITPTTPSVVCAIGPLAGLRHALLAQQRAGGVEVAVRLLERSLAIHHARARELAELLDEACTDLGHALSSQ